MRRKILISVAVLVLALVVAVVVARRGRLSSTGPGLDARLTAWEPFPIGGDGTHFLVAWNDGASPPFNFYRKVRGWESISGEPHLRVELTYPKRRRRDEVFVTEWLRARALPDGEVELLCPRRKVGLVTHAISPPQPVLRTPLEPGRSWQWKGRVSGFEAEATFLVLPLTSDGELRVEQKTEVRSATETVVSERVRTYAPGRGLIAEAGTFPVTEPNRPYDRHRSKVAKKTVAPKSVAKTP